MATNDVAELVNTITNPLIAKERLTQVAYSSCLRRRFPNLGISCGTAPCILYFLRFNFGRTLTAQKLYMIYIYTYA